MAPQGQRGPAATGRYFTAELAVLFLCLTALLVFLPLVLPPLPPPPPLLLLVPVGLMAILIALAFVRTEGRNSIASSSCA
jgi:4-hydroxybenzoate polyprenyltransferase